MRQQIKQEIKTSEGYTAYLYKGHPKGETPTSYKKIKTLGHNLGNLYNPSWLNLYQAKDKSLRYEIYRDGCFYPYFGKFEWANI